MNYLFSELTPLLPENSDVTGSNERKTLRPQAKWPAAGTAIETWTKGLLPLSHGGIYNLCPSCPDAEMEMGLGECSTIMGIIQAPSFITVGFTDSDAFSPFLCMVSLFGRRRSRFIFIFSGIAQSEKVSIRWCEIRVDTGKTSKTHVGTDFRNHWFYWNH